MVPVREICAECRTHSWRRGHQHGQFHRVFSNLKRWAMGTYHGLRKKHIASYLDEFVFRWNRRRWRQVAFDKLLGLSVRIPPMGYRELVTG